MIVAIKIMVIKNGLLATQILVTQYVGNQNFGNGKICGDWKKWWLKQVTKVQTKYHEPHPPPWVTAYWVFILEYS